MSRFSVMLALLTFAFLGCSDVGSADGTGGVGATGGGGTTGGAAGDGGSGGLSDTPSLVQYFFFYFEWDTDRRDVPLEGVRVCQGGTDNCTSTNANGRAVLDVPTNQEIAFTAEKKGYGSMVAADVSDKDAAGGEIPTRLYKDDYLASVAAQIGTPYPWQGGIVGLVRYPLLAGVTYTPVGATIDAVGQQFYFDSETEEYSLALQATTLFAGLHLYPLATGGFAEVTPGEQEFELGGDAGDCDFTSWGWPTGEPNRLRVPVLEGFMTYGSMICD